MSLLDRYTCICIHMAHTSPFLLLKTHATPYSYLSHSTPPNPRLSLFVPVPFYSSKPTPLPIHTCPILLLQTHTSPSSTSLFLQRFLYPAYMFSCIGRNRLYIAYNCIRHPHPPLDLLLLSYLHAAFIIQTLCL